MTRRTFSRYTIHCFTTENRKDYFSGKCVQCGSPLCCWCFTLQASSIHSAVFTSSLLTKFELFFFWFMLVRSSVCLFIYLFIYLFVCLFVCSYLFIHLFVRSFIRSFVCLFVRSFLHSFTQKVSSHKMDL